MRLEGNFVSKIVLNFPKRNPFASEVSLLSQGLKFKPTENKQALKNWIYN